MTATSTTAPGLGRARARAVDGGAAHHRMVQAADRTGRSRQRSDLLSFHAATTTVASIGTPHFRQPTAFGPLHGRGGGESTAEETFFSIWRGWGGSRRASCFPASQGLHIHTPTHATHRRGRAAPDHSADATRWRAAAKTTTITRGDAKAALHSVGYSV